MADNSIVKDEEIVSSKVSGDENSPDTIAIPAESTRTTDDSINGLQKSAAVKEECVGENFCRANIIINKCDNTETTGNRSNALKKNAAVKEETGSGLNANDDVIHMPSQDKQNNRALTNRLLLSGPVGQVSSGPAKRISTMVLRSHVAAIPSVSSETLTEDCSKPSRSPRNKTRKALVKADQTLQSMTRSKRSRLEEETKNDVGAIRDALSSSVEQEEMVVLEPTIIAHDSSDTDDGLKHPTQLVSIGFESKQSKVVLPDIKCTRSRNRRRKKMYPTRRTSSTVSESDEVGDPGGMQPETMSESEVDSHIEDSPLKKGKRSRSKSQKSDRLPCPKCCKLITKRGLKNHIATHSTNPKLQCNLCNKLFKSKDSLKGHLKNLHGGPQEKPFECLDCGRRFCTEILLIRHKVIHTGLRPFHCSTCEKTFTDAITLRNHELLHRKDRAFQCEICGKTFLCKVSIKRHLLSHEGKVQLYECNLCDAKFRSRTSIRHHHRVHSGLRPYLCEICGQAFMEKQVLKSHTYIHTGEKPFVCDVCGRAFRQLVSLRTHRFVHLPYKPHRCDDCGRQFIARVYLVRHKCAAKEQDASTVKSLAEESDLQEVMADSSG